MTDDELMTALVENGWKAKVEWSLKCSGCDAKLPSMDEANARHFDGVEERPGHSQAAIKRLVVASPWKPLT